MELKTVNVQSLLFNILPALHTMVDINVEVFSDTTAGSSNCKFRIPRGAQSCKSFLM